MREATDAIVLNAIDLEIDEAWVEDPSGANHIVPDAIDLDDRLFTEPHLPLQHVHGRRAYELGHEARRGAGVDVG